MLNSPTVVLAAAMIAILCDNIDAFAAVRTMYSKTLSSVGLLPIRQSKIRLNVRNAVSSEVPRSTGSASSVELEVMSLRAGEIKKILTNLNANTKGLYEKDDLAKLLIQIEMESLSKR